MNWSDKNTTLKSSRWKMARKRCNNTSLNKCFWLKSRLLKLLNPGSSCSHTIQQLLGQELARNFQQLKFRDLVDQWANQKCSERKNFPTTNLTKTCNFQPTLPTSMLANDLRLIKSLRLRPSSTTAATTTFLSTKKTHYSIKFKNQRIHSRFSRFTLILWPN